MVSLISALTRTAPEITVQVNLQELHRGFRQHYINRFNTTSGRIGLPVDEVLQRRKVRRRERGGDDTSPFTRKRDDLCTKKERVQNYEPSRR